MTVEITFADGIDQTEQSALQQQINSGWMARQKRGRAPLVAVSFSLYPGGYNFRKYHAPSGTCYRACLTVGRAEERVMICRDQAGEWLCSKLKSRQ